MQASSNREGSSPVNIGTAAPGKTRMNVVDLIAQAVLALAIALAIAITLAGIVLLLAGAAQASEAGTGTLLLVRQRAA